jgi:hypothetical protein
MKVIRLAASWIPFVLFCAGAYIGVKYNSGWWFLIGFASAWLLELVLRELLRSRSDNED